MTASVCSVTGADDCVPPETFSCDVVGATYYRLQADRSFARFFHIRVGIRQQDDYWVVQHKSGLTETYGNYRFDVTAAEYNSGQVVRWHLSRRLDPHENAIFYQWGVEGVSLPRTPTQRLDLLDIYYSSPRDTTQRSVLGTLADYEHHVSLWWTPQDYAVQDYAPVLQSKPPRRLSRVDVSSKPWEAAGKNRIGGAPTRAREMVRRYHLEYYPQDPDGYYRPGMHAPLRGHSFLKSVQLEGRCAEPLPESTGSDDGKNIVRSTVPATKKSCPRLPATTFSYTTRPKEYVPEARGMAALDARDALPTVMRTSVNDVDLDGWPDIVEGYWRVLRNTGNAEAGFLEDCAQGMDLSGAVLPPEDGLDPSRFGVVNGDPWSNVLTPGSGLSTFGQYVRAQNSVDRYNTIRFSRRSLGAGPAHITPMGERVRTSLEMDSHGCKYGTDIIQVGSAYQTSVLWCAKPGDDRVNRLRVHALIDMNGDGLADALGSSPLSYVQQYFNNNNNPSDPTAETREVFLPEVELAYYPGNGRGDFGCDPSRHSGPGAAACNTDLDAGFRSNHASRRRHRAGSQRLRQRRMDNHGDQRLRYVWKRRVKGWGGGERGLGLRLVRIRLLLRALQSI